jgi:hypothetical protein
MTRTDAIKTLTHETGDALVKATIEMDRLEIKYCIIEAGRSLLTQLLYFLQGRLDNIPDFSFSDLQWACQQAGIRPPDKQKITWTLKSNHLDGKAVDIMPLLENGNISWNKQDQRIIDTMKKYGFIAGADWEEEKNDPPHFEYRG